MSKLWEIDPETRSKLHEISKTNENNRCVDCGAPSPQWASPKFGITFCLACSGIHRSLGVHISFVRSITMDSFKTAEVERMRLGGNKPWRDFFNSHQSNKLTGRNFENCTISERYDSEAGEEWKERLTCKVEGREFTGMIRAEKKDVVDRAKTNITPLNSGRNTPIGGAVRSPPPAMSSSSAGGPATTQTTTNPSQKAQNEAYFSRLGNENASRPDNLPPSQGGKYAGFGSAPPPTSLSSQSSSSMPTQDDFQKDPMAALTKGFGWLSSTVSKQAATVNKSYIQPGVRSLQDGEFAAQARATAFSAGSYVQQGAKGVGDSFNKFVDPEFAGNAGGSGGAASSGGRNRVEPEKKDFWESFGQAPSGPPVERRGFWDDFAAAGDAAGGSKGAKPTSIGTSAMKTNTGGGAAGGAAGGGSGKEGDGWGEW